MSGRLVGFILPDGRDIRPGEAERRRGNGVWNANRRKARDYIGRRRGQTRSFFGPACLVTIARTVRRFLTAAEIEAEQGSSITFS